MIENNTDVDSTTTTNPHLVHRVLKMILPYGRGKLIFVASLVLLQGVLQVIGVTSIFPFLALIADPQRIYDSQFGRFFLSFLPEMDTSQLLIAAGLFAICMLFFANLINILGEFHRNRYAHNLGHWLRLRMLNQYTSRDYKFFLNNNSSVLVKKVYSDVIVFVEGVLLPMLEASARLVTSVLLIATLLFIHVEIAVTAAFCLACTYLVIFFLLKKRRATISGELKDATADSMVALQHLFGAIKPIKVQQTGAYFVDRYAEPSSKLAHHSACLPIYTHLPRYVIEPIAFGGMIALAIYFISTDRNMSAIIPNMGVMAMAGHKLLPNLQLLYGQITKITSLQYALDELYDESELDSPIVDSIESAAVEPLNWQWEFALNDVTFSYPGTSKPVLDSISLRIEKNTSVAFVGSTGSGKTTLIDLVLGLHTPQHGEILIDGQRLDESNLKSWQRNIGYVPQDVFLIDDTITKNIALGIPTAEIDNDRVCKAAKIAQILEFIEDQLPQGFETKVGERGVRMSGGQRQRIGLARALYHDPEILIFDEATSALDTQTENALMTAINQLSGEKTILMIAHRIGTVEKCDRIYVIEDGSLTESQYRQIATNAKT